jgi:hypothetical protein
MHVHNARHWYPEMLASMYASGPPEYALLVRSDRARHLVTDAPVYVKRRPPSGLSNFITK